MEGSGRKRDDDEQLTTTGQWMRIAHVREA